MTIAELLKAKPQAAEVLLNHGMHCLGCSIAHGETIEQAAQVHSLDINELLEELEKA
jgi:hybrid cluster-associated redox disulfide protein